MFLKRFRKLTSPASYTFVDPDTQHSFVARDMKQLITRIESYRSQNKLKPIESLPEVIENYLCSLPENLGKCEAVPLRRGWFTYLKGGVSLFEMLLFKKVVELDVAESRAKICLKCSHNVRPPESTFDEWADAVAEASIGSKEQVSVSKQLGICELCTCNLRAKIWKSAPFHLSAIEIAKMKEVKEVKCWQVYSP